MRVMKKSFLTKRWQEWSIKISIQFFRDLRKR